MQRRNFLQSLPCAAMGICASQDHKFMSSPGNALGISLNAYSFNRQLLSGELSLKALFSFASHTGFDAVDLTAYYLPGYPKVPEKSILFEVKRMAFRYGLALGGTGVRNDFTFRNRNKIKEQIKWVKGWVEAAAWLGAPHLRIFDGRQQKHTAANRQLAQQVRECMAECVHFASKLGVIITYQNHLDYFEQPSDIKWLMNSISSDWFGLMLDIGSLPGPNTYAQIEQLFPYACTWQIKEEVNMGNRKVPTDFARLLHIINKLGYTGFLPLETLGPGDPFEKVKQLYFEVIQHV